MIKHIVVVGMPRSGTTAFVEFLCDAFEAEGLPETHFFNVVDAEGRFHFDKLPRHTSNYPEIFALLEQFQSDGKTDLLQFVDALAQTLNIHSDILIEKTPSHLMSLGRVQNSADILRFIVMRPCRPVCRSLLKVDWNHASPLGNVYRWTRYALRSLRLALQGEAALVLHETLVNERDTLEERLQSHFALPVRQTPRQHASYDLEAEPWKRGSATKTFVENTAAPKLPLGADVAAMLLDLTLYRLLTWVVARSWRRHK